MKLVTIFNHRTVPISALRAVWSGDEFLLGNINADLEVPGCSTMHNEQGEPVQVSRDGKRYLVQAHADYFELREIGLVGPLGIILANVPPIVVPCERSAT